MPRRESRYRRAQARRAEAKRDSERAVRATTQIAGFGVAIVFTLVIVAVLRGPDAFAPLRGLAQPVLGPVTGLELIGYGFVAWIAFVLWRRLRK